MIFGGSGDKSLKGLGAGLSKYSQSPERADGPVGRGYSAFARPVSEVGEIGVQDEFGQITPGATFSDQNAVNLIDNTNADKEGYTLWTRMWSPHASSKLPDGHQGGTAYLPASKDGSIPEGFTEGASEVRKGSLGDHAKATGWKYHSFYAPENWGWSTDAAGGWSPYQGDYVEPLHDFGGDRDIENNQDPWKQYTRAEVLGSKGAGQKIANNYWRDRPASWEPGYAAGGEVIPNEGLSEFNEQLVDSAIAALTGNIEDPEVANEILAELEATFGPGAVEELMQEIQQRSGQGATESGMDDSVTANLTPGEVVVSNPQLADYGSGDREVGAKKLMKHLDDVSRAHRGTSATPKAVDPASLA